VRKGLFKLRDALSGELAAFFRAQRAWAGDMGDGFGNRFLQDTDKRILGVVDDLRHGIVGGQRLGKDPVVSVISTVTNSPGAVLQSGIGNVQKALATQGGGEVRAAIEQFLTSNEVRNLGSNERQNILDVAEVVRAQLDQQTPDASKILRWGKRLLELAQQVGVAVATKGLEKALFGGSGS
jgi:hypothetical protein